MSQTQRILESIETTNHTRFPESYENMTIKAALKIERLACKLRHIIYAAFPVTKPELMKKAAVVHEIDISCSNEIFNIVVPALLPKKNKSPGCHEFMFDPIYYALDEYFQTNRIEKFGKCVVVFEHIYSTETPNRRVRDYDNIDLKPVLDAVATFVMTDDGGKFCDAYNTTGYGKKDCTSVSVMTESKFLEWIGEHKKGSKTI